MDDFAWRRNGKLVAFRSEKSFQHCSSKLSDPSTQQVLTSSDLMALEPTFQGTRFAGAIYTPDEEVGDCNLFCRSLQKRLRASGRCTFMLGRAVNGIRQFNDVVHAVELEGRVSGGYPGDFCRAFERRTGTCLHTFARLSAEGIQPAAADASHRPPEISITDYDRKVVYARLGQQLRIAAMIDIVGFDASIDRTRIESIRDAAQSIFPNGGDYRHTIEWAGMRPATPTGVPIIGATRYSNLWLNVGHGALGFTLASASADVLTYMIARKEPAIDSNGFAPRAA